MKTIDSFLHITLNTSHVSRILASASLLELHSFQPLIQRRCAIPSCPPCWLDFGFLASGAARFDIYHGETQLAQNVLAWKNEAAAEAWCRLETNYQDVAQDVAQDLTDRYRDRPSRTACPNRPTSTPWLATMYCPSSAQADRSVSELIWLDEFAYLYARVMLDIVVS